MGERLQRALEYVDSGLSLIPISAGSKKPSIAWTTYRKRKPRPDELAAWDGDYPGLGIVAGAVSGGLEVFDLEGIAPIKEFYQLVENVAPGLLERLPQVKTPGAGRHVYYRCDPVDGSKKLAQRSIQVSHEDLPRNEDGTLNEAEIRKLGLREIDGGYFSIKTLID